MTNISNWFFRLAVLYLLCGIGLGLYMAASHDHSMFPAHAHLNLLGWVTMSLFAMFYRLWPAAAATQLAKLHFWIYVPAHFVQMITLSMLMRGNESIEPVLAVASIVVGVAVILFAVNAWKHTGASAPGSVPAGAAVR